MGGSVASRRPCASASGAGRSGAAGGDGVAHRRTPATRQSAGRGVDAPDARRPPDALARRERPAGKLPACHVRGHAGRVALRAADESGDGARRGTADGLVHPVRAGVGRRGPGRRGGHATGFGEGDAAGRPGSHHRRGHGGRPGARRPAAQPPTAQPPAVRHRARRRLPQARGPGHREQPGWAGADRDARRSGRDGDSRQQARRGPGRRDHQRDRAAQRRDRAGDRNPPTQARRLHGNWPRWSRSFTNRSSRPGRAR